MVIYVTIVEKFPNILGKLLKFAIFSVGFYATVSATMLVKTLESFDLSLSLKIVGIPSKVNTLFVIILHSLKYNQIVTRTHIS